MHLRATRYTGLTVIPGHARFAVEYGPVLLALVGAPWNATIDSMLVPPVAHPDRPETWLEPDPDGPPLHFRMRAGVRGAGGGGLTWKPYYQVNDELFEVYPAFAAPPPRREI